MNFELKKSIQILERTPSVLNTLLKDLPEDWTHQNEGPDTWSPFDVVGHLIHGERTDWIERTKVILSLSGEPFKPFDRFAQFENSQGKTLNQLLDEFERLRIANLKKLKTMGISHDHLQLEGTHPALGKVTLKHLLACWVAHDLGHIAQITRVMARQYKSEVGPWIEYLGVLNG